jgi:hypothetical protein
MGQGPGNRSTVQADSQPPINRRVVQVEEGGVKAAMNGPPRRTDRRGDGHWQSLASDTDVSHLVGENPPSAATSHGGPALNLITHAWPPMARLTPLRRDHQMPSIETRGTIHPEPSRQRPASAAPRPT